MKAPKCYKYVNPILIALKKMGGSAKKKEVELQIIEDLNISEEDLKEVGKNGHSNILVAIGWARYSLILGNLLDASTRGIWTLTEKGQLSAFPTEADLEQFAKENHQTYKEKMQKKKEEQEATDGFPSIIPIGYDKIESANEEPSEETNENYQEQLLSILKSISPAGFERLCQRLLRESGFEKVVVTGKSHDGGIDGYGYLHISPWVTFKVLFQCKRYQGSVGSAAVRDFRGAIGGASEKGIIMTTGYFSNEAIKEATRENMNHIELVDGEALVEMFERLELGLKPRKTFDIDEKFFDQFKE